MADKDLTTGRMFTRKDSSKFYVNEWSLAQYVDAFNMPLSDLGARRAHKAEVHTSPEWYGGISTRKQATNLLEKGWSEGVERLREVAAEISDAPTPKIRRRVRRWADDGEELSIDRALAGQWDHAYSMSTRQTSEGPQIIDLVGLFGGAGLMTAEEMFWQGAVLAILSDILESAGYRVRLIGEDPFATDAFPPAIGSNRVVIKEDHEPVRMDAIASVMCHAGTYRTHGFRMLFNVPLDGGEGTFNCPPGIAASVRKAAEECGVALQGVFLQEVRDRDGAVAEIRRVLAQFA